MRKLMLLAAMLAMVLVAAAPALAQDATAGDLDQSVNDSFNTDIQYADCDVIQAAAVEQYGGDANALGDAAAASVANEVGVSQDVVLACLGSTAAGDDVGGDDVVVEDNGVDDDADGAVDEGGEAAAAGAAASAGAAAGAESAGAAVLPDTGGASLFTLGAGALLVGGGLLARRIFR